MYDGEEGWGYSLWALVSELPCFMRPLLDSWHALLFGPLQEPQVRLCLSNLDDLSLFKMICFPLLTGTTGEPVSSLPHLTEQQVNEQVEKLTAQLQLMTSERDELHDRLAFSTNPFVLDESVNPDTERVKTKTLQTMVDLQDLKRELTEVSEKYREQAQETTFLRNFHRQLLTEKSHIKDKVEMQSQENRKLLAEQNLLQKSSEDRNRVCEELQKKICDLQAQQQQEKRERKLRCLLRQKELLTEQRDMALQMEQYFTNSEIRFKHLKEELEQINGENENILMEIEWLKMSAEYARTP